MICKDDSAFLIYFQIIVIFFGYFKKNTYLACKFFAKTYLFLSLTNKNLKNGQI